MGWSNSELFVDLWEVISPKVSSAEDRVKLFYQMNKAMEKWDWDAQGEVEELIMPDVVKLIAIDGSVGTVDEKFFDLTGCSLDTDALIALQEEIISYLRVN